MRLIHQRLAVVGSHCSPGLEVARERNGVIESWKWCGCEGRTTLTAVGLKEDMSDHQQ